MIIRPKYPDVKFGLIGTKKVGYIAIPSGYSPSDFTPVLDKMREEIGVADADTIIDNAQSRFSLLTADHSVTAPPVPWGTIFWWVVLSIVIPGMLLFQWLRPSTLLVPLLITWFHIRCNQLSNMRRIAQVFSPTEDFDEPVSCWLLANPLWPRVEMMSLGLLVGFPVLQALVDWNSGVLLLGWWISWAAYRCIQMHFRLGDWGFLWSRITSAQSFLPKILEAIRADQTNPRKPFVALPHEQWEPLDLTEKNEFLGVKLFPGGFYGWPDERKAYGQEDQLQDVFIGRAIVNKVAGKGKPLFVTIQSVAQIVFKFEKNEWHYLES